ncbi:oligosaccharide flippase family protein [Bacillus sp. B1-b2]|uniref:oligosaccharide flippase family protein n=1 Tax=Bacillus sp. B1-b2 TaxID=2653201 RepID=UPI001261741E|nr:oligosaccharide flippase family protein [Bacillus sp. B1-b2]KAB7671721.1 oligosaccharide flippase family protein [Bacillus sp. B1-b2]
MSKQIKFGVALSYVNTLINLITGILLTPITLRLFGQSEYGLYSLALSVMNMLFLFDFGFSNAIVKYVSSYKEKNQEKENHNINAMFLILYSIIGLIALICGLIISAGAEIIFSNGLNEEEIGSFKIMLIIVAINLGISFPLRLFSGTITAHEKFIFSNIMNILRFIMNPLVTLSVLFLGYSSIEVLIAISIVNFILSMLDIYYCFAKLKMKIKLYKFDFRLLKEITAYSIWVFVASLADFIYTRTDMFILGALVSSIAVAIYNVAEVINNVYSKLTMVLSGFFLPKIVRMVTNNVSNHELTNIFIKLSRLQFILAALVLTGFALVGHEFIIIWAGESYSMAYWIVLLVISSRFIPVVQVLATSILQAKNLHSFQSKLYLAVALLNLLLSIPLAMKFGIIGVAIGTVIGKVINTIVMNFYYFKIGLEMKRYYKEVGILFVPMAIIGLVGFLLKTFITVTSLADILLFAIIISLIYLLMMYFLFLNKSEKNIILMPVKRIVPNRAN